MPVVTAIKRQKRHDSRFSVYVDDRFVFALSDLDLSTSDLRVGQLISAEELEQYSGAADLNKAYNLALRYLSLRMRSRHEMAAYLRRKEFEQEQVAPVLERLEHGGFLNDVAFAAAWVTTRQSLAPRSKRRLEQELIAKGVGRDDIALVLADFDRDAELEQLVEVARRKQRLPQYRDEAKLLAYLARQGYGYDLIKKALTRLDEGS